MAESLIAVVFAGLKTYSNWPTYPQFYVKGELIGGLDIVKEMADNGELVDIVPVEQDINSRLCALINSQPTMLFMKVSGKPLPWQRALLRERLAKYTCRSLASSKQKSGILSQCESALLDL